MKKKVFEVSRRDRRGDWHDMGLVSASSMIMARTIAYNMFSHSTSLVAVRLGLPGNCETHRVKPGHIVYEYSYGALCVKEVII